MNEDKKPEYIDIDANEELGGSGAAAYEPLEVGAIYKANIDSIRKIAGTDFDGNPNVQLVFGLKEAESGQVYNFYATESLHEKAKLNGFLVTLLGEARKFKKDELLGLPLQFTVKPSKMNAERQVPDKILKADKAQKRLVKDTVVTDIPDNDPVAEAAAIFGEGTEAVTSA